MWNANSNDGIVQKQGWQSGLEQFKVKVPIGDFLEDIVSDHMCDNHEDWYNESDGVETCGEVYIYVNVNSKTGQITVVGAGSHNDAHPLDQSKRLK